MNEQYLYGFGAHHQTEAVANTLPRQQNSPGYSKGGLYTEQLSGSAFTAPRAHKRFTWCYRLHPSVGHGAFEPLAPDPQTDLQYCVSPNPYRWKPLQYPNKPTDFIQGLRKIAGHGAPQSLTGAAIHWYAINTPMSQQFFSNHDAELLIVPQEGTLEIQTELGPLTVPPLSIAVIPRGIRFQLSPQGAHGNTPKNARGYVCENFGHPFELPELGPIGANGLANPRHFAYPKAQFTPTSKTEMTWVCQYQGQRFIAPLTHSPFDVVAWHGNYAPYCYDLRLFNTLNTVSFDHPDPSIFTVLTSPSPQPGVANVDFVIFPPRWMVAEHTFRPPYFHRNLMSEFMGLIQGHYDAKQAGFLPGGASLHNRMSPHGPDRKTVEHAAEHTTGLKPVYHDHTMAFMFESLFAWDLTPYALHCPERDHDYQRCWEGIPVDFQTPC
jgi:homogentisate 1,2-dioxygenase